MRIQKVRGWFSNIFNRQKNYVVKEKRFLLNLVICRIIYMSFDSFYTLKLLF